MPQHSVIAHYDKLPDRLLLIPGVFNRHNRYHHYQQMLLSTVLSVSQNEWQPFWCVRRMIKCEGFWDKPKQNLSQFHEYSMPEYLGNQPTPAVYRPQGRFIHARIQPHQPDACLRTCVRASGAP